MREIERRTFYYQGKAIILYAEDGEITRQVWLDADGVVYDDLLEATR